MKHLKLFEEFKDKKDVKWWHKYTKYNLSIYPVNIPEEKVTIDITGDVDSHPVMTWISPGTGKKVYAYTKARMDSQKEIKYERLDNMSEEQVEKIKLFCNKILVDNKEKDINKQSAAIISIIAQSGLRPGSNTGFEKTKNRGVSTLSPANVSISKQNIKLNFIGKSFKENNAEINDGILANYLSQRIKKLKKDEFIFDVSNTTLDKFYKETLGMKDFKIKDLRTYIANKVAKEFLDKDPSVPPPVPDNPADIKKAVKLKLQHAFEEVSKKLNNTPSIAKMSYVNPQLITKWLDSLGVKPAIIKEDKEEDETPVKIVGNAPLYNLPDWWDTDIELVKIKDV
jgi:DNA topoisomerase IB